MTSVPAALLDQVDQERLAKVRLPWNNRSIYIHYGLPCAKTSAHTAGRRALVRALPLVLLLRFGLHCGHSGGSSPARASASHALLAQLVLPALGRAHLARHPLRFLQVQTRFTVKFVL